MILEVSLNEVCALLVFGISLLTAWNANANGFVWDDRTAVLTNDDVQHSNLMEVFSHDFWGTPIQSIQSHKSYRPLTVLSFRLNYLMAKGHSAWLYHFTNTLVHAMCAVLVWKVANVLFQQHQNRMMVSGIKEKPRGCSLMNRNKSLTLLMEEGWENSVGVLTTGLLFAVHPIHCDAVASIVGRADLLCTLFSLSAFIVYVDGARKLDTSWGRVMVALLLTITAGLCKELGFSTFALLIVYDLLNFQCYQRMERSWQVVQKRVLVVGIVGLVAALIRVLINGEHQQMEWNILANNVVVQESRLTRMMSYAHVHAWYLWKLVWPRWLCFDYGYNTISAVELITDFRNLLTLIAYTIVGVSLRHALLQLSGSNKTPASSLFMMSIAFGVIPFFPASNIIFPVGTVVAERLMYFPSVGFCLLVGCIADQTLTIIHKYIRQDTSVEGSNRLNQFGISLAKPKIFFGAARIVMLICGTMTIAAGCYRSHSRNADWIDEQTLFRVAVDVAPTNLKVLSNEAKNILNLDPEKALGYLRVAIGMLPKFIESQTNAGLAFVTLAARNTSNEDFHLYGIRHLYKAAMLAPDTYQALGYIGVELYTHWTRTLQTHTDESSLEDFYGSGSIKHATAYLDLAINRNTSYPTHYYNRGSIAYECGDFDKAIYFFQMTEMANNIVRDRQLDLELLVEASSIYNMIGISYRKMGDVDKALDILRRGIELYPEETDLQINAALILKDMGNHKEADEQLKAALVAATKCEHVGKLLRSAEKLNNTKTIDFVGALLDRAATLKRDCP
ncbi:FOG: TPR repeat [Plasmopara halstedii]|uniref:dolichyl-phosphate-mannose--protein mannosyltransferase n=1 Tax=Plasmopara halstedii TaxID=4781 RepID=A0A0P1AFT7_PLAHL|nr:FOG: TPR repeat [Plasmopara halstedii]CEG39302.1 FOG: TPR repeat [Plasmopara halstedii]|eukprot:XP_024575671.1 FOG: TPR repeat [Plasmopara halstedii]